MPAFAMLDDVSLSRPDGVLLFSGLSLVVGKGSTGLIGRNGCGKSSLLRVLADPKLRHGGHITRNGTASLVRQSLDPAHEIVADALGVAAPLATLARLVAGAGTAEDAARADWLIENRLDQALSQVGLTGLRSDHPIKELSGGERMRLMLARVLLHRPDLLLLDEPTNNMDAQGRSIVHEMIANFRGGVVVASHDRDLLERMGRIVELTAQSVHVTGGGWTAHAEAREQRVARAKEKLDRAEAQVAQVAEAARNRAEKQARRDARGRRGRRSGGAPKIILDRRKEHAEGTVGKGRRLAERQGAEAQEALTIARSEIERLRPMSFSLPRTGLPAGREVLSVKCLTIRHPGRPIIGPVSFSIAGPERVAISGPNGSGKTSILRAIAATEAGDKGTVTLSGATPPVLDQHLSLLCDDQTLLENMQRLQPSLSRNLAHATLARFAFRNTDADRIAGSLSGGERLRAALCCVFSGDPPPELLILDEPTNHLDLTTIEELEVALAAYDGAVLVVSHDITFLDRIGVGPRVVLPPVSDQRP